jgi:hypothetical protein
MYIGATRGGSLETNLTTKNEKNVRKIMKYQIDVENSDIVDFPCDVVVLKYAQAFFGADAEVARRLKKEQWRDITPAPDDWVLLPTFGAIEAKQALFVGVVELYSFEYEQIRKFASRALELIAQKIPSAQRVAMTMHGIGYGLDEREAFLAQIAGLLDAFRAGKVPPFLGRLYPFQKPNPLISRSFSRIE